MNLIYKLELTPYQSVSLEYKLTPEPTEATGTELNNRVKNWAKVDFAGELAEAHQTFSEWEQNCTRLDSNHYGLNRLYETSVRDLRSLMQQQPQGLVVTAGIPWYFTLFGRDSLITSLQTLSLNTQIAIDTLRALAAYQATEFNDWRDSEPGKILHELRLGDMTLSGEMPHGPYYGSVDSTLLFILCFAETLKWTNDPAFFAELWPAVEKAIKWAEDYGDIDKDGYIKFSRRSERGILHQGWKDSDESMGGTAGPRPFMPIALVEVQGYYYAALVSLSISLKHYGDNKQRDLATQLEARAAKLKENFNRDFWWEEVGFFAQAIDGQKNQIRNITSNPGHCLWSGIVDKDKAEKVVARLMQPDMLSGWGIRTMSVEDPTYNPMSYHNGSIWPHDNALIIAGLRRYGYKDEALAVANQLLEAAATFPNYRLPELYCGFAQYEAGGRENAPAAYPVSCSPQAWAAGAGILLMQSLLGIEVDAFNNNISNNISLDPFLPNSVETMALFGLRIGTTRVNLDFRRNPQTGNIEAHFIPQSTDDPEVAELIA
jgi:glycogen debranching enzyme